MTRSPRRPASRARRRSRRDPKGHVWTIRHRICTPRSPEPRYRRPRGGRAKGPHPGWGERAGNGRKGHGQRGADPMSHGLLLSFEVTILVLAIFLGFEVISKVPTLLHTPLMSGTNAIHGIVVVGAMIVLAEPGKGAFTWIVGFLAVVLGSANVVGGFVVTDRMLEMFKKREKKPDT